MSKINLEKILLSKYNFTDSMEHEMALQAMKEACKQILDLVCENVLLNIDGITEKSNGQTYYVVEGNHYTETEVKIDKQSILDTLKEIE